MSAKSAPALSAPTVAVGTFLLAAALSLCSTGHHQQIYIQLVQTLCYTTIAVTGLNILLGLSGQMPPGQAGSTAGAYGSALLSAKMSWPVGYAMLAGVAIAGLLGVAVGLVALRTRGIY